MSLRLEMLQVARLARKVLGDSAELSHRFLLGQVNGDGGFKDRAGNSDLYYTVFGLQALAALANQNPESNPDNHQTVGLTLDFRNEITQAKHYLESFGRGEGLDFVHLCCLARCWAAVSSPFSTVASHSDRFGILERLETWRSEDGGYNPVKGTPFGTAYGAFLALGAYQDCGAMLREPLRLVQSLKHLETPDGAWANERLSRLPTPANLHSQGATNATAAAVTVLRNLGQPLNPAVGDWLRARAHDQGGFLATPATPMPDLLSTATALHALAGLEISLSAVADQCLDFVDSLWTNEGGFYGHWGDDHLDCEYTFYGLLALGHLSMY